FYILAHGSDIYSGRTYYEQPWLDDSGETVMRPDNKFIIELYKPTAANPIITDHTDPDAPKVEPYKTVTIPCGSPSGDEYTWRSYALGNFRAEKDVTWDFSDGGADPCFVVTIVDSNVQDESVGFYEVYDIDGNKIREFGMKSGGYAYFPAIEGHPEQFGFDVLDSEGSTVTQLIDWPSLEVKGQIPALFEYDGNIYTLSSVPTRVAGAGGVLYAANAVPSMGTGESAFTYVAYFYPDGSLQHIDTLHLPDNTAKAYAYVTAEVLDPYLYNTDSNYEYLVWHYTWRDAGKVGTSLSLVVVDNTGKILAERPLPDSHSNENAFVSNHPDQRYIVMSWRDATTFLNPDQMEFISLPLNDFEGEGTVADPYLVKTYGDFDRMRNNLTSHFALAGNLDLEGRAVRPVEGTFLGSLDGRGHLVKNLYVSGDNKGALFMNIGQRPAGEGEDATAAIRDITFTDAVFAHGGNSYGTKQYGLLAHTARYAEFSRVSFVNPTVGIAGVNTEFGTLAHTAENVTFTDCAVVGADYDIERARGLGGIAYDARGSKITGAAVSGSIKGNVNIGGVIGVANSYPTAVADCHIDAVIEANGNVGGVIGTNNSRSTVRNCIVEGSISATSSVGGIVGELAAATDADEEGMIVENNVVALSAFNVGEAPEAAHRVVGYSSIDDGAQLKWIQNPDWDPEDPNSSAGSYQQVDPQPEQKIGVNHVIGEIAPVDPAEGLATEGTTTPADEADEDFYAALGFRYGSGSENPWTRPTFMSRVPALYYEAMVGASIEFVPATYTGIEGETIDVVVEFENLDPMDVFGSGLGQFGSSDESVASFNGMMDFVEGYDNRVKLQLVLGTRGEAELYLEYNGVRATARVTVSEYVSVETVGTDNAALRYDGSPVAAEGRRVALYDAQGRLAASGISEVRTSGLPSGLYIAVATAADGRAETMKVAVR
nr:T9SS type A sorting domain-containing protein [Muribaculaceae bacterium]